MYINALGMGELLPRSGDFFGSGAISPHHTMYINALGTGELLPRSGDFFESRAISPHYIVDIDIEVIIIIVVLSCKADGERNDALVHKEDEKRIVDEEEFVVINLEVDGERWALLLQEEEGEQKSTELELGMLA
jgi:hypothetical protein